MTRSPSSSFWLTSIHHRSGYDQSARNIIVATLKIVHRIRVEIPEFYILVNLLASVAAFEVKEGSGPNVLRVNDAMSKKGWHFAAFRKPAAVHISVTVRTPPVRIEPFLIVFSVSPIDPDGTGCGHVDRRSQERYGRGEIFRTWRGRYDGRLVRFGTVECCLIESRWIVGGIFRGLFVQGVMRSSTWWYVRYVVRNKFIASLWATAHCDFT